MLKRASYACALLLLSCQAMAGNVIPEQEYDKYIDKHRTVQALEFSLFGEQVNLRDGGVMFRAVDAELAGNGPTIRVARTFRIRENNRFMDSTGNSLAGWMLEIPRLKTITNASTTSTPYGWQVPGTNKDARCSNFSAPGTVLFPDPARFWEPYEWWSGYQMVDDLGNEQELLAVGTGYPEVAGFKAVTTGNWRFSCLTSTSNGQPGEGFLGTAPDGTRYWFDYLVYTTADSMSKPISEPPGMKSSPAKKTTAKPSYDPGVTPTVVAEDYMMRRHAMLLVTRVEDRFGNWITYQYSGGVLNRIDASDGRALEISRAATPVTVSLNTGAAKRTWSYVSGSTSTVTLPDGSAWTYNFSALAAAPNISSANHGAGSCDITTSAVSGTVQGAATSPSGVTGTFTFALKRFGRSYVFRECMDLNGDGIGYAVFPVNWVAYALTQRTFSGPGLPTQSWNYAYSPAYASWSQDCTGGCTAEVWADVTAPDGVRQRTVFSNRFDETENLLLREETYSSTSVLMRKVIHGYATYSVNPPSTPYAWPQFIGDDLQMRTNKAKSEHWTPASRRRIEQQNRVFTWEVPSTCGGNGSSPCFDNFARPTKVVKTGSP